MALPKNRPHFANLTPTQIRQGIKRLEQRRSEVEGFYFGTEDDNEARYAERLRSATKPLQQSVTPALAKGSARERLSTFNMRKRRNNVGVGLAT